MLRPLGASFAASGLQGPWGRRRLVCVVCLRVVQLCLSLPGLQVADAAGRDVSRAPVVCSFEPVAAAVGQSEPELLSL